MGLAPWRRRRIAVRLALSAGALAVEVRDDGAGFGPAATPAAADGRGGIGMRSMRERAAEAGAVLRIERAPGAGRAVIVEAPISSG
jgi:signal transduction histidine kinase